MAATSRATLVVMVLSALSCASSSATHPPSPAEAAAAKQEWSRQARGQIRNYWNPWDVVRTVKTPGSSAWRATTVLRLAVQADGTAPRPEIVGSSGVPALDDEAVRAVAAALPLPAPPRELLGAASSTPFVLGLRVVRNEPPSSAPVDDDREPFAVILARIDDGARGAVDPLDVQRTVESETYRRDVSNCLSRQRDVGLEESVGEVTIEFVITEAGGVDHPIVAKTRGLSRSMEGCLVSAISLWTFRKPTGGAAKVMFPFRFGGGQAVGATPEAGMKREHAGGSR